MANVKVRTLERKRQDYSSELWKDYDLLYRGGTAIKASAGRFLIRNPVEHQFWYETRVKIFQYKNLLGPLVDDYTATVLRESLELNLAKPEGAEKRPEPEEFYTKELWPDPTGAKSGDINKLARHILASAMVKKQAWVIVATPDNNPGYVYQNRAEQEAAGDLRVTLNQVPTENVFDAHWDHHGLAWVKLRNRFGSDNPLEDLGPDEKPKETIQWTLYTRKSVQRWEIKVKKGEEPKPEDEATEVGAEADHKLADANDGLGACPVQCFQLDETLWMADRVSLMVLAELRKRNALSWYEDLTCFPQITHKGDEDLTGAAEDGEKKNTKRGAQYAWQIEKEGDLYYLEPSGASLPHLKDRLDQMERDVYKGVQQMAAAQGPAAAAAIQSGASKVRDNIAKTILCALYAHEIRSFVRELANLASEARSDDYDWVCGGASRFDTEDQEGAVRTALTAQGLGWILQVPTLQRQMMIKTARALLPDASTGTLDTIESEINALDIKPEDDGSEGLGNLDRDRDGKKKPPSKSSKEK